jgi:hypothetical protein
VVQSFTKHKQPENMSKLMGRSTRLQSTTLGDREESLMVKSFPSNTNSVGKASGHLPGNASSGLWYNNLYVARNIHDQDESHTE